MATRMLVTGGAGFVGSSLALAAKRERPETEVVALDNLKRRGSELALPRLREGGVRFLHGDIRNAEDLESLGPVDLILECSAEPSVQAGYAGDARYLVHTNLAGTVNCLELARRHGAGLIFLSTSRVYPIAALCELPLEPRGDRLVIPDGKSGPGWSAEGIATDFPLAGSRSLYGATKLCSELLIQEYASIYGFPALIDRCGVIAGPGQMARVDQGFVTLWAARHRYGGTLEYRGFGGEGRQVRDVLHIEDLHALVSRQMKSLPGHAGEVFNVGGGLERSVSLRELSRLCAQRTGAPLEPASRPETHPSDIPYYVTDNREVSERWGWQPRRSVEETLDHILAWLGDHRSQLEAILA
jgi:CDP-paratose 2-epimerase